MIDTDNSTTITNSEIYIINDDATSLHWSRLRQRPSVETLNGQYVAYAEQAVERLKKRWPRVQLSAEDVLQCVEIKLKQTNHQLDLLAKLKCNPAELTTLEDEYGNLRDIQESLIRPTRLNPWEGMKYLVQVCALKKDAKALFKRSQRLSERIRSDNRTKYSSKRNKGEVVQDPLSQQRARACKPLSTPASEVVCDEAILASDIVYSEIRDSDDEDSDDEEQVPSVPSTSRQHIADPVVLDA
ncbi:hypothetical protein ONZ45_g9285 [Pleurotus djamor]|nr:hypothetical protein ONZ45_g9285 [Pleurotus djamor]